MAPDSSQPVAKKHAPSTTATPKKSTVPTPIPKTASIARTKAAVTTAPASKSESESPAPSKSSRNSAPLGWAHGLPTAAVYKGYGALLGRKLATKYDWRVGYAAEKWISDCPYEYSSISVSVPGT